jgi:hypothetical protein
MSFPVAVVVIITFRIHLFGFHGILIRFNVFALISIRYLNTLTYVAVGEILDLVCKHTILARFQASAAKLITNALVWAIMQRAVLISLLSMSGLSNPPDLILDP